MSQYMSSQDTESLNYSLPIAGGPPVANSMDAGPVFAPGVMPVYTGQNCKKEKE